MPAVTATPHLLLLRHCVNVCACVEGGKIMSQSLPLLMHLLGSDNPAVCMIEHTCQEVIRMAECVGECGHKKQGV